MTKSVRLELAPAKDFLSTRLLTLLNLHRDGRCNHDRLVSARRLKKIRQLSTTLAL